MVPHCQDPVCQELPTYSVTINLWVVKHVDVIYYTLSSTRLSGSVLKRYTHTWSHSHTNKHSECVAGVSCIGKINIRFMCSFNVRINTELFKAKDDNPSGMISSCMITEKVMASTYRPNILQKRINVEKFIGVTTYVK